MPALGPAPPPPPPPPMTCTCTLVGLGVRPLVELEAFSRFFAAAVASLPCFGAIDGAWKSSSSSILLAARPHTAQGAGGRTQRYSVHGSTDEFAFSFALRSKTRPACRGCLGVLRRRGTRSAASSSRNRNSRQFPMHRVCAVCADTVCRDSRVVGCAAVVAKDKAATSQGRSFGLDASGWHSQ